MIRDKIKILVVCVLFFIVLAIIYLFSRNTRCSQYVYITQLKNNNPDKQMMGYYIKSSNGKVIVIDGGTTEDSENLQNYIYKNGGKVDYWLLTHYHDDHAGAIRDIILNTDIKIEKIIYYDCGEAMVAQYEPHRLEQYQKLREALENVKVKDSIIKPVQGQIFTINNNVNIKIISTYEYDITENFGNNSSTVFKLNVGKESILFLGDTGKESSEKLLNEHRDELKSDYVQMAHHGQNGGTLELYQEINPTYCFWPTPNWLWDNDLGEGFNTGWYNTLETRKWIENLQVEENYVEKDGDITIKLEI